MRAYSNMPTNEFVAQLRAIAINAGARPLVVAQIDAIVDAPAEDEAYNDAQMKLEKLLESRK